MNDTASAPSTAPATKSRLKPGERRTQILQVLAAMLQEPGNERITTAALAARLQVSEAALYRHFASKAKMFEALMDFVEQSVLGWCSRSPGTMPCWARSARKRGALAQLASWRCCCSFLKKIRAWCA